MGSFPSSKCAFPLQSSSLHEFSADYSTREGRRARRLVDVEGDHLFQTVQEGSGNALLFPGRIVGSKLTTAYTMFEGGTPREERPQPQPDPSLPIEVEFIN